MVSPEPMSLPDNLICITIDVDWAAPRVLADMVGLLDAHGIKATIFCSHEGIEAPGHERALHPNFRRSGDSVRRLRREAGEVFDGLNENDIYKYVVDLTKTFCPEALGVRAHSLIYDSQILPLYHAAGLQYESNYLLPLTGGLQPVMKEYDILEIPIFFNDHFELKSGTTGFRMKELRLDSAGLKVFQFHPNMVFLNAATNEQYLASKPYYHDYERLCELRFSDRGARTLFLELLDFISTGSIPVCTLGEVNAMWRKARPADTWR